MKNPRSNFQLPAVVLVTMIEAGEYAEAARSLEGFRRKYPEYTVPEWQAKLNKN